MPAAIATKTSEQKVQSRPASPAAERCPCNDNSPYVGILRMQRTAGNRTVSHFIQTKLHISVPGDRSEVEADETADRIMRMPQDDARSDFRSTQQRPIGLQRTCTDCQEELQRSPEPDVRRKSRGAPAAVSQDLVTQINASRGSGASLPVSTRTLFEDRFGYDFSHVRVHAGANAASMAQAVNARAFTVGHDIFFGANQYSPGTSDGRRLVAHELTHVIQQSPTLRRGRTGFQNEPANTTSLQRAAANADVTPSDVMIQRDGLSPLDIARGLVNPTYLVGAAWLALPTSFKIKVIDLAIDANLMIVDAFPGLFVLGPMWEFIRAGLVGFWEKLKSATADLKIKAVDTMARIISGQSVGYALGMVTGLVKGFFVEGAAGIFIAVWDLVKGLKHLWNFMSEIGKNIGGFPEDMRDIFNSFVAFGDELLTNIGPAIEELAAQAGNPTSITGLLSTIAEKGKAFAKEGGEKIADAVLELFTKKGAEAEIGETVGSVIGQVLWEVLFAVVTAGAGAAVTAGKVVIKEAVGVLTKLIGKVVGSILKLIHEIRFVFGKVIEVVKKAVSFVKGKLAAIGNKLGELLEKVGNFLKRLLDNCHESTFVCDFARKLVKKITGTVGLDHSFDKHAHEWFGRAVNKGTHLAQWESLIERTVKSGKVFEWTLGADQTMGHFATLTGKIGDVTLTTQRPFAVFFFKSGPRAGELASAFVPTPSQVAMMKALFK
jgi:uncharacterized protein DUF4157